MERIVYRITLDNHKTGVQRTLQGFQTSDILSRRISIGLVSGSDTYEIPADNVVAMMYVTTPNALEPSILDCVIEENTIICDLPAITVKGVTGMQMKLIETSLDGAKRVLVSPKFAIEVTASETGDESAEQSPAFSALEEAIARAMAVYNSRMIRFEITEELYVRVHYADGTIYENDYFHDAVYNQNTVLAESFAKGGTGYRAGEETDNAKYYSLVAKSEAISAKDATMEAESLLAETQKHSIFTAFYVNFETGNLEYVSSNYNFDINESTGELEVTSDEGTDPETLFGKVVDDFIDRKSAEIDAKLEEIMGELDEVSALIGEVT